MKASSNYHKVKPQAAVSAVQPSVYSNEVSVSKLQFYYTPMIFIALFTSEDLSAFAWKNLQKFTEKKKKQKNQNMKSPSPFCSIVRDEGLRARAQLYC